MSSTFRYTNFLLATTIDFFIIKQTNTFQFSLTMENEYNGLVTKLEPYLIRPDHQSSSCQYWVGIAGGPGSGKSTIATEIARRLNEICQDSTIVVGMDGWHIPLNELIHKHGEEGVKRRGAPWTFDVDSMVVELQTAKRNGQASLPVYSREISNPVHGGITISRHHRIVFVEGLYVLMKDDTKWCRLYDLWDETWFVECPSRKEQVERLVSRSLKTWSKYKEEIWGPAEEGARKRTNYNDLPNMDLVAPTKQYADVIIVNS